MRYGPFYPTTVVSDSSNGGVAWSNPGDAAGTPDADAATATVVGEGVTAFLKATGFNADVPADKIISRAEMHIAPTPQSASLNISDAQVVGAAADSYNNGDDAVFSEDDTLTPGIVNDAGFGFAFSLYSQHGGVASVESLAMYIEAD